MIEEVSALLNNGEWSMCISDIAPYAVADIINRPIRIHTTLAALAIPFDAATHDVIPPGIVFLAIKGFEHYDLCKPKGIPSQQNRRPNTSLNKSYPPTCTECNHQCSNLGISVSINPTSMCCSCITTDVPGLKPSISVSNAFSSLLVSPNTPLQPDSNITISLPPSVLPKPVFNSAISVSSQATVHHVHHLNQIQTKAF